MVLCLIFGMTGCAKKAVWTNKSFDEKAVSEKLREGELIAENENYKMVWVSSNCSVALIDKQTAARFGTTPIIEGEPQFDALGMPIKQHAMTESAVVVEYLNPDTNVEEISLSATSAVKNGRIRANKTQNGVLVEYYFDDVDIMIPVNYTLRNDSVEISVDPKEIQENEKKVTSISLVPFWCSVKNDSENSYLFYPSGSGAVINSDTISQVGATYLSEVYGRDPVMTLDDKLETERAIRLPVYGSKSGEKACVAIIESAAESTFIETKVGSSAIKHSGVYAKFQVRGYSENLARFMHGVKKELNIYSLSMIKNKLTIGFYPLQGEKADYSGMAEKYRDYLGLDGKPDEKALNVSFVGGIMVDKSFLGVPYKTLLASTTINDAEDILKDISKNAKTAVNARLIGFGSSGLGNGSYAGGLKIGKSLGDKKALSALSSFCDENKIDLYFDFDIISLKKSSSGYNKFFDVAYSSLNKIADVYKYDVVTRSKIDKSKYNLLSRELLSGGADKVLKAVEKWNIDGISLSTLSYTAYSDYSSNKSVKYYSKGNIAEDVKEIYSKISKKYKTAGDDANAYAAIASNIVYNSPLGSSDETIFAYNIPFYQMVFKGSVALAGEAVNTAENWRTAYLNTIEAGCGLNYTLTAKYYKDFINHNGNEFYSSKYSDIKDKIFADYGAASDYYSAIKGAKIAEHNVLEDDLRETVYENGVRVYVNYSKTTVSSPIGEVAPESFVFGEGL